MLGDVTGLLGSLGYGRRKIFQGSRRRAALDLRRLAARQQLAAKMGAEIFFGKPAHQSKSRAAWLGMDAAHQQLGGADGLRAAGAGESGGSGLGSLAEKRKKFGEALLYDRMCAGGGWNCGNPEVYGVAGEPLVIPTTWALLALRRYPQRRENVESLAWMERNFTKIQAPASYAAGANMPGGIRTRSE